MVYRVFCILYIFFILTGCDYSPDIPAIPDSNSTAIQTDVEVYDIIPLSVLRHRVCADLGIPEDSPKVFFSDRYYLPYSLETVKKFLITDKTNEMSYIPELRDCDDFAKILMGKVAEAFEGIPFGIIWYIMPSGYFHAENVFYDAYMDTTFMIEPQDDTVRIATPTRTTLVVMKEMQR